jgi:glycosyltransferase involved in cell wall biosynthesis
VSDAQSQIAVVMPCHNASATVAETIASVQAQQHDRWTLVVVDDGSTDDSADVVRSLQQDDDRIELITQANAGVASARNAGVARATGAYVAFIDADDRWRPDYLTVMQAAAGRHPAAGVLYCSAEIMHPDGKLSGVVSRAPVGATDVQRLIMGNPATTASTMFARAEAVESIVFSTALRGCEDVLYLVDMINAGWDVVGIDDVLVDYRTSPHGLSADLQSMRRDWERMVSVIDSDHDLGIRRARARQRVYLARRAVRLGRPKSEAFGFALESVRSDPRELLRQVGRGLTQRVGRR